MFRLVSDVLFCLRNFENITRDKSVLTAVISGQISHHILLTSGFHSFSLQWFITSLILFNIVLTEFDLPLLCTVTSGSQLSEFQTKSAVRTCGLSFSGNLVMYTTDKAMSQPCEMLVYDLRDEGQMSEFAYFNVIGALMLLVEWQEGFSACKKYCCNSCQIFTFWDFV